MSLKDQNIAILKQIYSSICAAELLYAHGYYKEFSEIFGNSVKRFNDFIAAGKKSSDCVISKATELFIQRYASSKFWTYDIESHIEQLKEASNSGNVTRELIVKSQTYLCECEKIFLKALRHYKKYVYGMQQKRFGKMIKWILISLGVLILGQGVFFIVKTIQGDIRYSKTHYANKEDLRYIADIDLTKNTEAYVETSEGPVVSARKHADGNWRIGKSWWFNIFKTRRTFGGTEQECIWFHPVQWGTKVLRFKNVTLGKSVVVFYGLADGCYAPNRGKVVLQIIIGDNRIEKTIVQKNKVKSEWNFIEIDTSKFFGKKTDITFRVSTPKADGRWFCIAPYVKEK